MPNIKGATVQIVSFSKFERKVILINPQTEPYKKAPRKKNKILTRMFFDPFKADEHIPAARDAITFSEFLY